MGIVEDKNRLLTPHYGTVDQNVAHDKLKALERWISRLAGYGALAVVLTAIVAGIFFLA